MSETITLPPPIISVSAPFPSKWEREHAAFRRLLPHLLIAHRGKYAAVHGEQVVDYGDDKLALAMSVLARIGNTDIYVGLVTDQPAPIARSGVRRELFCNRTWPDIRPKFRRNETREMTRIPRRHNDRRIQTQRLRRHDNIRIKSVIGRRWLTNISCLRPEFGGKPDRRRG